MQAVGVLQVRRVGVDEIQESRLIVDWRSPDRLSPISEVHPTRTHQSQRKPSRFGHSASLSAAVESRFALAKIFYQKTTTESRKVLHSAWPAPSLSDELLTA